MLAAAAAHHFLGDETASSDEIANSMEQSEDMPAERHRRFWVKFFLKVMND